MHNAKCIMLFKLTNYELCIMNYELIKTLI